MNRIHKLLYTKRLPCLLITLYTITLGSSMEYPPMFLQFCFPWCFITTLLTMILWLIMKRIYVLLWICCSISFIMALFTNISYSLMLIITFDFIIEGFDVFFSVLLPTILYNRTDNNYILVYHLQNFVNNVIMKQIWKIVWNGIFILFMTDQNIIYNRVFSKASSGQN